MDIPLVINESSWLPGPYDNQCSAQPIKECNVIENYTAGLQVISICTGNEIQYLNITSQVWLSIINTTKNYHNKFYMLHASSFKG